MPPPPLPDSPPQISFSNWLMGGRLVKNSSQDRAIRQAEAAKQTRREKLVVINEKELKEQADRKEGNEKKKEGDKNEEPTPEEKEKSKEDAKKEETGSPPFNPAQDKTILDMKSSNKPWNEICVAVGSRKPLVIARYVELICAAEDSLEKERDEKQKRKKDESAKDKGDGDTETDAGWKKKKQDDKILSMKLENKPWKEICLEVGASKKDCINRFKTLTAGMHEKGEKNTADPTTIPATPLTPSEPVAKPDEPLLPSTAPGPGPGPARQPEDQTPAARLQPDTIWTREDCEMLELLEARYRDQKWLHVQAGFYNLTGRMVGAEVIRRKFGG